MQELLEQLVGYLRGIWQRRWFGLAIAWAVAIGGVIYVFRLPDQYEASARVYVDTQSMLRPLMAGMAILPDASQQVGIVSRLMLSRPNVEKIIRKSDLDTAARAKAEDLIDATASSLRISRAGGDNLYTISFRYTDGRKARDVVQAALTTFMEQSLGNQRVDADTTRKFLDQQIKEYATKLDEAESRMQAFRLKYMGLIGTSGNTYVVQMSTLADQIKEARVELRVAEQTRDGIRKQLEEQTMTGHAGSSPEAPLVAVPELDGRILALKRQIDELLLKYTEQHPDVRQAQRILKQLTDERDRVLEARFRAAANRPNAVLEGDPVAQQLKVALNEAEANIITVRARLAEYETRHAQLKASAELLPTVEKELAQLNRDQFMHKRQYDNFVSRRETVDMSEKLEDAGMVEFRIVDPPRVTPTPVAPNRLLLLAGVVGASLAAGLAISFVVSQIRPTFHEGRALREFVGRPLLGMVTALPSPELRQQQRRAGLLFAGGMGGLLLSFGVALAFTFLKTSGF